jgi:hypothetical protein
MLGLYDGIATLARIVLRRPEVQLTVVVLGGLLAVLALGVARRRAWSSARTWAGVGAAFAFAVLPATTLPREGVAPSVRASWGHTFHCTLAPRLFSADPEVLLNTAMLVPFGFLAVLCLRRVGWVVAIAAAAVLVVELVQTATALGTCQMSDLVHNTLGAALGAGLAVALLRWRRLAGHLSG